MKPAGGLKLQLRTAVRDDRRLRFAEVIVETVDGPVETVDGPVATVDGPVETVDGPGRVSLVTDSGGALRYHLPAGNYRLHVGEAPDTPFTVSDRGWTPLRVLLS